MRGKISEKRTTPLLKGAVFFALFPVLLLPVLLPRAAAASDSRTVGDAARGKELFLRYCSGCHGEDGRGEAKTFRPAVGNLAVRDLMDQVPDEYLFTVIKSGGAAVGKNAAMPAWSKQLGDQDIWDLIVFVRTLSRY